MTNQQLQQQKIAPDLPVRLLQLFINCRHGWQMRSGRHPQHCHLENVVVGDVEHNLHTWTVASIGLVAVQMT
jgi:hypothetical protein